MRSASEATKHSDNQEDIMKIFEQRNKLFDIERYKGKNSSPLVDARAELMECANVDI